MTSEYLQLRLSQWQSSSDMDALMRAADSLNLLSNAEHRAWTVDNARAAELVSAIQASIKNEQDDVFFNCEPLDMRYWDPNSKRLLLEATQELGVDLGGQ